MKKNLSKKKMFNIALAATLASGAVVAASPVNANAAVTFKDVSADNVHAKAIFNLAERGIIKGFADGTFGPNKAVTRGQVAKIIAGILELDTKNVENPNFKDVKTTDEYYGAIAALKAKGIISGKPDGTYGQYEPVTRGQMAKIIVEAFGLKGESETPFTDVPETNTFANYIKVLYGNKVTTGTTATTFSPNESVKRGQLASFVVRAESVETTPPTNGGSTGSTGGSGSSKGSLDSTVDSVVEKAINQYDNYSYVDVVLNKDANVLEFKVIDPTVSLTTVKTDMAKFDEQYTINDILKDPNLTGIGTAYDNLNSVTVEGKTYTKAQLLDKDFTKGLILNFVDDNKGSVSNIGGLVGKSTTVTVDFGSNYDSVTYTLKIVNN